jgi:hypothetical protein
MATNFNISAMDQFRHPEKIFEEINKNYPQGRMTSRSAQGRAPFQLSLFNLSEILMRIPAYDSPENALQRFEGLITGVLGSFWDSSLMEGLSSLLPSDLRAILETANPDGIAGIDGTGDATGDNSGSIDWRGFDRRGITPSKKPLPAGVKPVTRFGAQVCREILGFNGTIGGMRQGPGTSDHITGHAIDVMVGYGKARQKQEGDMIAQFFYHNREALRVKYVIWYDQIASSRQNWKWRYYDAKKTLGRTDPTGRHLDHPHISFLQGPAPSKPKLEWPDGVIVGSERQSGGGGGTSLVN